MKPFTGQKIAKPVHTEDSAATARDARRAMTNTTISSSASSVEASAAAPPFVTVGVIVRNEAATIVETLQSLLQLQYAASAFEIIVVDGASTDGTYALAKDVELLVPDRIRLVRETKPASHGRARNLVIQNARFGVRYFAFTDGDCCVPPNWLQTLVEALEIAPPQVAGCGGPRGPHPGDTGLKLALGYYLANPLATGFNPGFASRKVTYTRGPANYNAAYRADVLRQIAYDPNVGIGEDLDLNYRIRRAGFLFLQVPTVVAHHGAGSLGELRKQMTGYGRTKAAFLMRHQRVDRFTSLAAPSFVLGTAFLPPIAIVFPGTTWGVLGVCAAYACLVLCVTGSVTWRMRSFWGVSCFPAAIITHLSYGTGFIQEMLRQCIDRTMSNSRGARTGEG